MAPANDRWDLSRFLQAQSGGVYEQALAELRSGRKTSHWMWFIFPQLRGLGRSSTAQYYGLDGQGEATAYLQHPVLGPRLTEATQVMIAAPGEDLRQLLGTPDDLKFRSCMTLFDRVAEGGPFETALQRWCGGERDRQTEALLATPCL